jgi:hypothetical protein
MAAGRCAGCGHTETVRKVELHILTCQHYLTLFRSEPGRCLAPEAELQRHRTHDNTSEHRAARRDDRLRHQFADLDRQQQRSVARWRTPPDILAD